MRPERQRSFAVALALAAALAPASACHKKTAGGEPPPDETASDQGAGEQGGASGPSHAPPGPTGTISGQVILTGTPPEMPLLQRGSDAVCARKEMHAETILTGSGGALQNVVVRVKPGAVPGWVPSKPAVVDQRDCMYRPRVQGVVMGQMLVVKNSDQTSHNVHARRIAWGQRRATETVFNRGQPPGAPDLKGPIRDEGILELGCDQHGWMKGYLVVSDNPYFATSDAQGTFTIDKAPVGTYQLQAWHEFYGIKTATVTVEAGKTAKIDFVYDADKDRPAEFGGPSKSKSKSAAAAGDMAGKSAAAAGSAAGGSAKASGHEGAPK